MFDFDDQLERGLGAEQLLDLFYGDQFAIAPVGDGRAIGSDREFTGRLTGNSFQVEYKMDARAGDTGRYFIETVHESGGPGWGLSCRSRYIVIFTPHDRTAVWLATRTLWQHVRAWSGKYASRTVVSHRGVTTLTVKGIAVPIASVRNAPCCVRIDTVPDDQADPLEALKAVR